MAEEGRETTTAFGPRPFPTRATWLAIHRYLGLATLIFLALAAITGCLLCFNKPLDAALNPDLFRRSGVDAFDPLNAAAQVEAAHPELRVLTIPLQIKAGETLQLDVAAKDAAHPISYDQVFVDDANGHVAGVRQDKAGWERQHILKGVYSFHYTLLAGTVGRWLMGICALGWLIGNVVGVYLTWPRRAPFLKSWTKAWVVRLPNRLPKLMLDLHRASGLWLLVGVTLLAFTSVSMNFFDEAFTPVMKAMAPTQPSPFDHPTPADHAAPRLGFRQAVALGTARSERVGLRWRPAAVAFHPDRNLYRVTFTQSGFVSYRGLGPVSYYFDGVDGRFIYEENPYRDSAGLALTRLLYPLHSGQIAGPVGVAVIFMLGLATLEMCFTGGYVWWKRRAARFQVRGDARR